MKTRLTLLGILVLGLGLRFYGLNWDDGYHFHPDERMIVMTVEKLRWVNPVTHWQLFSLPESPMNPKFFAYGSLPLYLLKFLGWIGSRVDERWATYNYLNLLGRGVSAVVDGGTILLVYWLGKWIANRRVGLLGALFYAMAVLPVQLAHFYAVDTLLAFFMTLSLYLLIRFFEKRSAFAPMGVGASARRGWKLAVASGMSLGAAVATKVSGIMLGLPLLVVVLAEGVKVTWEEWHKHRLVDWIKKIWEKTKFWERWTRLRPDGHRGYGEAREVMSWVRLMTRYVLPAAGWGIVIVVIAGVVAIVSEPYAVFDRATWWRQIQEQSRMTKDAHTFPYTLQYVDTPEYVYQLTQILKFGLGWGLGIMALAGVALSWVFMAGKVIHRRWLVHVVPDLRVGPTGMVLLFLGVYYWVVGGFAVKFVRYMLPIYPLLTLMAAVGVMIIGHALVHLLGFRERQKWVVSGVLGLVVAMAGFAWVTAFMQIYDLPNTRILASEWMVENIPKGSKLGLEHWDDALPVPPWRGTFGEVELPLYEPDSYTKWAKMAQKLQQVDAVVIASDRLYRPLMRLENEFPLTERYYRKLFNGELGFVKTAEFTNYPRLGSWVVNDDLADETFHVYDHPKIMIFEKRVQKGSFEYLSEIWTE